MPESAIEQLERAVSDLRAANDELEHRQEQTDGNRRQATAAVAADAH